MCGRIMLTRAARPMTGLLIASAFAVGCITVEQVAVPTDLMLPEPDFIVEIEPAPGQSTKMTIGDEVIRYSDFRLIVECCPTLLGMTVPLNGWRNTFVHADGRGYSNQGFCRGDIGLVLDENLNLVRWIQIGGMRRWRQGRIGGAPLFNLVREYRSHWWLRYGGESEGFYRFEIVERPGDSQSEVIQPVSISEEKFIEGFFVRGVGIRGLRPDQRGTIEYQTFEASP